MTAPALSVDITLEIDGAERSLSFSLQDGITALIGPSGAGKTTLARAIAGLQPIKAGDISLYGTTLSHTPVRQRGIGLIMQESALFPTMNVRENIDLAQKISAKELDQLIEITEISSLMDKPAAVLSGGEARRVAIVRALAAKPKMLILDEPTTGLDPIKKREILRLCRKVSQFVKLPMILITHSLEDILCAADHALLLHEGVLRAAGPVADVMAKPETAKLLDFDDAGSLLTVTISGRKDGLIKAKKGNKNIYLKDEGEPLGSKIRLRILARDVALSRQAIEEVSILNQLKGQITKIVENFDSVDVYLDIDGAEIKSRITKKSFNNMKLKNGMSIYALIKAVAVKELMPIEAGAAD